jgi:pimeloyl-ACP methyl ester carboxylesterase
LSSIVTEQGILHYESIGRGRPIILLHGWINSWQVWRDAMLKLADTGHYRVYALDFWGFGESGHGRKVTPTTFQIASYVEMVREFMDRLGIQSAPVFGHSMGGTVALQLALKYPARIQRVAIVGSPIVGNTLNPLLQLAGYGRVARFIRRYPFLLNSVMHVVLARDAKTVRYMIFNDVQRTTTESFFRSIGDLRDTDLRPHLGALSVPALGIFGQRDNIVSPRNARLLMANTPDARVVRLAKSRHFPMIDEPEPFLQALNGFLEEYSHQPAGGRNNE